MSEQDRIRWNERYLRGGERGGAGPDPFLVSQQARLPACGRALDVAGGAGRHALWLASLGLEVVLVDIAEAGLALAAGEAARRGLRLEVLRLDLEQEVLPPGPFAVAVAVCYLQRSLYRQLVERLAPGGWLVVVHPTRRNLERHGSPGPAFLLEEGELSTLLQGEPLDIVELQESWSPAGRHEARLLARRLG